MPSIEIRHDEGAGRYVAEVDGEAAGFAEYERSEDGIVFTHTVVEDAFEGLGVGSRLAVAALDGARSSGVTVTPRCSFIASYIERHPEYADLVRP